MELNTSQPQHSEIIGKPSRNPILFIVIGVAVIVIAALGLLVWQKNQEISDALGRLADAEGSMKYIAASRDDEQQTAKQDSAEITKIAEANYYAQVAMTNPDPKLKISISKLELPFARVGVSGSMNGTSCIYKKVSDTWVQLYCAQSRTPESIDLDARYGVPESLIRS